MPIEAEIARQIYEEVRASAVEKRAVRLSRRIHEAQHLWPGASADELLRAHLIAYELLLTDVSEALSRLEPDSAASIALRRSGDGW